MSTYAPPPRPARLVNELPALVNERPAPVVAPRTVTIRWDSALTAISTFAIGLVLGVTVATSVMSAAAVVNEDHAVVNEDPYSGVPACTDRIADAGGICHGEPLPPCPTEDSTGCYWDAQTMGNGRGRDEVTP
jgi:hypothetical protein